MGETVAEKIKKVEIAAVKRLCQTLNEHSDDADWCEDGVIDFAVQVFPDHRELIQNEISAGRVREWQITINFYGSLNVNSEGLGATPDEMRTFLRAYGVKNIELGHDEVNEY